MNRPPPDLADRARQLARLADAYPALAARAERLADRAAAQRFHVAVVGAFKRGKSTVINALLDQSVLPVGVLPLTAIATEVAFGRPGATIVGIDGGRHEIGIDDLARYVTEAGNPDNRLGVARAEVRVDCPLLASGMVLVDTPGLGSVHGHDDDTHRAVEQSDAAIVVLAADMALADDEQQLLAEFVRRQARVFVVVNKADHVSPDDLDQVRGYVTATVGAEMPIWCVSARAALDHAPGDGEFGDFRVALDRFVADDLAFARNAAAVNELRDIAEQVDERCRLEAAAASLDADQLADISTRFRRLADAEHDTLTGEHLLLAERCRGLQRDLAARLTARARRATADHAADLTAAAEGPIGGVDARLDATVDGIVRSELAEWQTVETGTLDSEWRELADAAHTRAGERITAVRNAAADLFAIDLAPVPVGKISDEPDTFWFLLTPPASMSDPYIHLGRRLQPAGMHRGRAVRRASKRLADELDKHAGRLRHALTERLDHSRHRFIDNSTAALDAAIDGINDAIATADHARETDTDAAATALQRAAHALDLAAD